MIGSIDIKVNAARPNLPLAPLFAFQDSPSSLRVMDVPKSIGNWAITSVKVAIEYPDNTTVEKVAVRNGSVWVATLEGSEVAGKVLNGYSVLADGKDEDGNDVTGYVLGKGDVFILENDTELSRLVGKIAVRYMDEIPDVPTKGDLMNSNGELRLFDGEDWVVISTTEPPPVYDSQITIKKNGTPVGTFTVNADQPKAIDIPVPSRTSDIENDSGFITVEAIPSNISSFNNDVGYITEAAIPSNVTAFNNDAGYITQEAIPSVISAFQNDVGYITAEAIPSQVSSFENDAGYITASALPTKVSELENDSGYITESAIPSNVGAFQNDVGYLTSVSWEEVQDKPDVALMSDIPSNVSELENDSGYLSAVSWDIVADKPAIPSTTNDLTNDSGFITASAIPSNISAFNNDVGYITANALPTKVSELENDSGFITLAQVPTPSCIEDANGLKIEADLDCTVKDLTLPWTLVDGQDTYTLNYAEQSGKWLYEETETKKIELTYSAENSLWELAFYVWNNGEWQYNTGSTTTQEEDATSLSILEWTLTRSIMKSDKLAKESDLPTKTSDLVNDSGYITASQVPPIPSNLSDYNNDVGYITASAIYGKRDYDDQTFPMPSNPTTIPFVNAYDTQRWARAYVQKFKVTYDGVEHELDQFIINPEKGMMWYKASTLFMATKDGETFYLRDNNSNIMATTTIFALKSGVVNFTYDGKSGSITMFAREKTNFALDYQTINGNLVLKANGTSVGSYSPDNPLVTEINIPVPSNVSELENDVGYLTASSSALEEKRDYNDLTYNKYDTSDRTYKGITSWEINGLKIGSQTYNITTNNRGTGNPTYGTYWNNGAAVVYTRNLNTFLFANGGDVLTSFTLSLSRFDYTCTWEDSSGVQNVTFHANTDFLALKSGLPAKVSELENDVGFITASAIPSNVSAFNNDAGYLTASSSAFTAKRDKSDLVYKVGFDKDNLDKVVKFVVKYVDGNNQNVTATLDKYDEFTHTWTGDNTNWKVYTYLVGMEPELYFALDDGTDGRDAQPAPSQGAEDTSWNFIYNSNPATWTMVMAQNIALQQDFKNLRNMKDISYPASVDSTGMYTIQKFYVNGTEVAHFTASGSTSTWDTNDPVVNTYEISTTDGTNFTILSNGIQLGTFTMTNLKNGVVEVTYDGNTYTVGSVFKQTTFALKDYVDSQIGNVLNEQF